MFVGGHGQQARTISQALQEKLTAGERITARVLGPTRHGLSVSIGRDIFELTVPSKPVGARTLTLQAAGPSLVKGGGVRVIAQDERPLAKPIAAKLTLPTVSSPPATSTIIQKGELEVSVTPLTSQGKIAGPNLGVRLLTAAPSHESEANPGNSTSANGVKTEVPSEHSSLSSKPAAEPIKPLTLTSSPAAIGASTDTRLDEAQPLANRMAEQIKSPVPMSNQTPIDNDPQPPKPKLAHADGQSIAKTEAKGNAPTSFVASAASLLSGIKHAIVGRHPRPDASQPGPTTAPSVPTSQSLPADGNKPPVLAATSTHPASKNPGGALASRLSPPASSSGNLKTGVDRGLEATAVVVARTPAEKVILEAKGQLYRVEQSLDLPLGTTLQAIFSSSPAAMTAQAQESASETRATLLNQLISILDDIDTASRYEKPAGDPEPKRQLPMPDRHLASRFLSLLSLNGEATSGVDPLPSGQQSIPTESQKDQIQGLLRELRGLSGEPSAEGWKSTTLPLGHDQGQAVMFHVRDQLLDPDGRGASDDVEQGEIQRAVFDVSFSQLGRCQIDVLCQDKRFDLLMRGDSALPSHDQQAISVLFRSACEIAGVKGEINFKVGDFFEPVRAPVPSRDLMT